MDIQSLIDDLKPKLDAYLAEPKSGFKSMFLHQSLWDNKVGIVRALEMLVAAPMPPLGDSRPPTSKSEE